MCEIVPRAEAAACKDVGCRGESDRPRDHSSVEWKGSGRNVRCKAATNIHRVIITHIIKHCSYFILDNSAVSPSNGKVFSENPRKNI